MLASLFYDGPTCDMRLMVHHRREAGCALCVLDKMKLMKMTMSLFGSFAFTCMTQRCGAFQPLLATTMRRRNHTVVRMMSSQAPETSSSSSSSSSSASSSSSSATQTSPSRQKVPITLLSGFLGSGKTSTLQHLLENRQGIKIGVIVNDMASVNIDAKLISDTAASLDSDGVVELQNGCACCSLADDLLTTVDTLLETRSTSGEPFDALVVELSGVADPMAIKQNWNTAQQQGLGVTRKATISQVVNVVDASTFGTDWMTWDSAGRRENWVDPNDECAAERMVPELLAEQIEAADVLLLNKADLAGKQQVRVASALVRTINDKAEMETVEYGRVTPEKILQLGTTKVENEQTKQSQSHSDHNCDGHKTEPSTEASTCSDPSCDDPTHSHSHSHDHACSDPDCDDPSHSHTHDHTRATATDNLGITSFVYRSDRPFDTQKLLGVLQTWPVPVKDDLDLELLKEAKDEGYVIDGEAEQDSHHRKDSPFLGVLRSKGFCWLAPTRWNGPNGDQWRHDTAMYWSHAGKHFGFQTAGKWWGTLTKDQIKKYFTKDPDECERILKEDFVSEEYGDRRQEVVFIGVNIDEEKITNALNSCLLSDKGMERYQQSLANFRQSILNVPASSGPSLFDVGGTDHMDVQNSQ